MLEKKRYNEFGDFLKRYFPYKVQKISIHAGFTCPNRDGSLGVGGCTYCNNQTFNPAYCHTQKSITEQLEEGRRFFARKYLDMKYLAYFQAYTNTYDSMERLKKKYEEALAASDVVGLIIGTRPDCMPDELLAYLQELSKSTFLLVEYGVESTLDRTLQLINRGHTYQASIDTIVRTHEKGILTGAHLILGLPGESREEMLHHATALSQLPLDTLKLHQLQIIKGTQMAKAYNADPLSFNLLSHEAYLELIADFIEHLHPNITLERFLSQSPKELIVAPDWGLKNYEFTSLVKKKLLERGTVQGARCGK